MAYQVLPLQVRVDLGTMAMKEYFAFPKAPALLEPHHQIVLCHIQDKRVIVSRPARTYLHQLGTNIRCNLEDLLEVMNDKAGAGTILGVEMGWGFTSGGKYIYLLLQIV